jgi:hypothetical protein
MINWDPIIDRHCVGVCEFGKLYIRLNREDEVIAVYTMWDKEKYIPQTKNETLIGGAKRLAQTILKNQIESKRLLKYL